ncbi:MAG: hypothetical protein FWG90_13705 [Oscillospiraceae bacterium]|nr:hypothetical protein [Oscillospiraceae bacterium]
MGMTDSQFKFALRGLNRDIKEVLEAIRKKQYQESSEKLEEILKDIQATLED